MIEMFNGRYRNVSVFPRYGCGIHLCNKLEGKQQHELRQPGYPYFPCLWGEWAEDITVWTPRPANTGPGWAGDMLKYVMLSCPKTATQVTSACLCGSSVFQILRDWHWESLKCHLLFMESQETVKAWILSTNRSGFLWGFFAFEVAKCKEQSLHFSQCHLQQPSAWCTWLPSRTEVRLVSSHHKQPHKMELFSLDFHSLPAAPKLVAWSQILLESGKRHFWTILKKQTAHRSSPDYIMTDTVVLRRLQWLWQQSPGTQGLYLRYLQQWAETYDVLWSITHLVQMHCCTMQQSLLKASQPWRENTILSHWQRSYGEEWGRAKEVSQHGEED